MKEDYNGEPVWGKERMKKAVMEAKRVKKEVKELKRGCMKDLLYCGRKGTKGEEEKICGV